MKKCDLKADLQLCYTAAPGPWQDGAYGSVSAGGFKLCNVVGQQNAKFIAQAREGWPHAIERAIEAEDLLSEVRNGLKELGCSNHACHFNPPKGLGTNGGCSCLSQLPSGLRIALTKVWIKAKEALGDE